MPVYFAQLLLLVPIMSVISVCITTAQILATIRYSDTALARNMLLIAHGVTFVSVLVAIFATSYDYSGYVLFSLWTVPISSVALFVYVVYVIAKNKSHARA